jgi:hypothetical protein
VATPPQTSLTGGSYSKAGGSSEAGASGGGMGNGAHEGPSRAATAPCHRTEGEVIR